MNVKRVHKTYMSFCDVGIVILQKKTNRHDSQ